MELECGGGTILILVLSIFFNMDQHVAQATNLIFFVPTSLSAILTSSKEKLINWKIGILIAIFGIIGAVIGTKISINMNVETLKKYFGIFLMLISFCEIYLLIKEYKSNKINNTK